MSEPYQRKVTITCTGLYWADMQLTLDALDLLSDVQLAAVEVNVLPAEAEDFTAAHAIQQQENERRI